MGNVRSDRTGNNGFQPEEIATLKMSWERARSLMKHIGVKLVGDLVISNKQIREYFELSDSTTIEELSCNTRIKTMAHRMVIFFDSLVGSFDLNPDKHFYDTAQSFGIIHYYNRVSFTADNWLMVKRVTIDNVLDAQLSSKDKKIEKVWNKFMTVVVKEMKKGYLDQAVKQCQKS